VYPPAPADIIAGVPAGDKKIGVCMLILVKCKRCGKPIYTNHIAMWGDTETKKQLGNICPGCITPAEVTVIRESVKTELLKGDNHV